MTARVKVALLLAAAMPATAAAAVNAQAQSINPPGPVSGTADFPHFEYGGSPIVCDTGTLEGTADGTDRISDVTLAFFGMCGVNGAISAQVACQGTLSLMAIDPFEDSGTLQPNPGFRCDVTTELCVLSFRHPNITPGPNTWLLGEGSGDPKLEVYLELDVVNNGSELCGPQFGRGSFSALYDVSPATFSFDP
jgi:hypothetical protein